MRISRIVVQNLRSLKFVDIPINAPVTCVIGENNAGKSCLIHAIRLCLDTNLSSNYRKLSSDDIHSSIDRSRPFQVLIGIEFEDFAGNINQEALLHSAQTSPGRARIFYRFRPKRSVREELELKTREVNSLTLEDYSWELVGGGNPDIDLSDIAWNTENNDIGAQTVGLQYLQAFLISYLPALRDVEADLQQYRKSPLTQLIEAINIPQAEKQSLVAIVEQANRDIESSQTLRELAVTLDKVLEEITGSAFKLGVDVGLSAPSFEAIVRNIKILLSGDLLQNYEPRRNGLGLNNLLYIAILIEHFRRRSSVGDAAGELILIEEPEAHLHPQLQHTLYDALASLPFQSILTTHSVHITSRAPLRSYVTMTIKYGEPSDVKTLSQNPSLTNDDFDDLGRYLDVTKSSLLFARKVMLVEGIAEALLIPVLARQRGIDLEREGISVVPIHGTYFGPFARLFSPKGLTKKCAIVADADRDVPEAGPDEDESPLENYSDLENAYVKSFLGVTTFERELTIANNLAFLASAAATVGAPRISARLTAAQAAGDPVSEALKKSVLSTAKRFGKGRFAQIAASKVGPGALLPPYINQAIDWLLE